MKKATKPATRKVTKSKPKTGTTAKTPVKAKTGQQTKTSDVAKPKKVTRTKPVLSKGGTPKGTKPKTAAGSKPGTKAATMTKPVVRIKAETKPTAKAKPAVKKKPETKATPPKVTAAPKSTAKTSVEKKPRKVAAPKKATPKTALKSPLKKVARPAKIVVSIEKKKTIPAKKSVPAAAAKKKAVASVPKKTPGRAAAKPAAASKKPKTPVKPPLKAISKTKVSTAERAKQPLKKAVPAPATSRLRKPVAKKPETKKPEEKSVKKPAGKIAKTPAKPIPVATGTSVSRKEVRPVARTAGKIRVAEIAKEPVRKKQGQPAALSTGTLKKTSTVSPAASAVAEEHEDELLSVAEIEAREGRGAKPRLKIFLPKDEAGDEDTAEMEDKPGAGHEALPAEYGENEFFMIVIDPILIFLDWEIMPADLPAEGLPLCVRIYDVTGISFDGTNAHGFIDIDLEGLTGSGYCEIGMQGREIVAEIGFMDAHGVFMPLLRSARASVPPLLQYDELGIVRKMQEAGLPVGY